MLASKELERIVLPVAQALFFVLCGYLVGYTHRDMTYSRVNAMSSLYIASWIYCAAYTAWSIGLQVW
jgi:hypothetical protein